MFETLSHIRNWYCPLLSPTAFIEKDNFCDKKMFFMLSFCTCLCLPMRETTPSWVIFFPFNIHCGKTTKSPDGGISSFATVYFYFFSNLQKFNVSIRKVVLRQWPQCLQQKGKLYDEPVGEPGPRTSCWTLCESFQLMSLQSVIELTETGGIHYYYI